MLTMVHQWCIWCRCAALQHWIIDWSLVALWHCGWSLETVFAQSSHVRSFASLPFEAHKRESDDKPSAPSAAFACKSAQVQERCLRDDCFAGVVAHMCRLALHVTYLIGYITSIQSSKISSPNQCSQNPKGIGGTERSGTKEIEWIEMETNECIDKRREAMQEARKEGNNELLKEPRTSACGVARWRWFHSNCLEEVVPKRRYWEPVSA